jgi:tetratricopeptide (TPR) repeat protein
VKRVVLSLVLALILAGCSRREDKQTNSYVYAPIVALSSQIAVLEKPDALKALLVGDGAKALKPYLSNTGIKCFTALDGKFDMVIVACSEMSEKSFKRLLGFLSENGIVVWLMDVTGLAAKDFRRKISVFSLPQVHLWMPGETNWVLVGRKTPRNVKLSAMLDFYSRESAFADFAFARCSSLQEVFANYVGTIESIMPAFERGDLSAVVKPEFFLERNARAIDWMTLEGVDKDIVDEVVAKIQVMQNARREVVNGNIASAQAKDLNGESAAIDLWAKAAQVNPNDMFLLERLDRLDRNAKGFMAVRKVLLAMKCYETMALIRPDDPVALHNFGMCLKKIGKLDLAEKVLERAKKLAQ